VDPFALLGLGPDADEAGVKKAFRERAQRLHPDVGGSTDDMAQLLDAYRRALVEVRHRPVDRARGAGTPTGRRGRGRAGGRVERDVASFTVDVLPVVAFEGLHLVAASLGDIADEDPPYMVEFLVRGPDFLWCRCDLVPDAGATTVAVGVSPAGDQPLVRVEQMRDILVAELNSLDWS